MVSIIKYFVVILLLWTEYVASNSTVFTSNGATYIFGTEGTLNLPSTNLRYYSNLIDSDRSSVFLIHNIGYIRELDSKGQPCCSLGCNATTECKYRTAVFDQRATTFNSTITSSTILINGTLAAYVNKPCKYPATDNGYVCAEVKSFNELVTEERNETIGNYTMKLRKDSIFQKFNIRWPFNTLSSGLRFEVLVEVRGVSKGFYLLPQNEQTGVVNYNNFEGVAAQDNLDNQGAVGFASTVLLDGVPSSQTNISAFYADEITTDARYVYIDVPKFTDNVELYMNIYIPTISGENVGSLTDSKESWLDKNDVPLAFGLAVAGSIICCCISVTFVVKCFRRR